jgi:hypothetical protein
MTSVNGRSCRREDSVAEIVVNKGTYAKDTAGRVWHRPWAIINQICNFISTTS